MEHPIRRGVLLLPVTLTFVPLPEMCLPMYYLAPSVATAVLVFALACAISTVQMMYQYWAMGEVERLAPVWSSAAGTWFDRQTVVKAVVQRTPLTLFLLGLIPGLRAVGTGLWRTTGCRWGGCHLAIGAAIQLAIVFGSMLGLGGVISGLFR